MHFGLAVKVSPGRGKPDEVYLSARRELKVEFQEPFLVFADTECHYFVTQSGKAYYVPRLDMPKRFHADVRPYHVDPKRPIRTIVTSPDHMRTFLAGPDGEDGTKLFYIELFWHKYVMDSPKPYAPDLTAKYPKPIEDVSRFGKFLNDKMLFSMPDEKKD